MTTGPDEEEVPIGDEPVEPVPYECAAVGEKPASGRSDGQSWRAAAGGRIARIIG